MQPSNDYFDAYFQEQLRQLRAEGHSPEEAASIMVQALKAFSVALQKLLEQSMDGALPAEQESAQRQRGGVALTNFMDVRDRRFLLDWE